MIKPFNLAALLQNESSKKYSKNKLDNKISHKKKALSNKIRLFFIKFKRNYSSFVANEAIDPTTRLKSKPIALRACHI